MIPDYLHPIDETTFQYYYPLYNIPVLSFVDKMTERAKIELDKKVSQKVDESVRHSIQTKCILFNTYLLQELDNLKNK